MRPLKRTIKTLGSEAAKSSAIFYSAKSSPQLFTSAISSHEDGSSSSSPADLLNMTVVRLSDEELVNMDIKDLNDYLRQVPKEVAKEARKRRRLLKNRGYAQSTRTKRLSTIEEYAARKMELKNEIAAIRRESERLKAKREQLRLAKMRLERAAAVVGKQRTVEIFPMDEDVKDFK